MAEIDAVHGKGLHPSCGGTFLPHCRKQDVLVEIGQLGETPSRGLCPRPLSTGARAAHGGGTG